MSLSSISDGSPSLFLSYDVPSSFTNSMERPLIWTSALFSHPAWMSSMSRSMFIFLVIGIVPGAALSAFVKSIWYFWFWTSVGFAMFASPPVILSKAAAVFGGRFGIAFGVVIVASPPPRIPPISASSPAPSVIVSNDCGFPQSTITFWSIFCAPSVEPSTRKPEAPPIDLRSKLPAKPCAPFGMSLPASAAPSMIVSSDPDA